jgi:hypothetical protein
MIVISSAIVATVLLEQKTAWFILIASIASMDAAIITFMLRSDFTIDLEVRSIIFLIGISYFAIIFLGVPAFPTLFAAYIVSEMGLIIRTKAASRCC